ncbi:MAG: hypothetical protein PWQ67_316 [Clostridia bacterium]|nr:hypothetical protein [Clostridia bacterium]
MGSYALIESPSLWALLPLIVYIIMVFMGYRPLTAVLAGIAVGFILTGQSPASFSKLLSKAPGSFLGLIGVIIMFGSGLGVIMTKAGVSQTIVNWIVKSIGVNTKNKAILAVIVASVVICGLLGTLAGGTSIIAPIIIPVVASVGITPSTVGAIFQSAGETGLIWGPFTPPVVALLAVTGLSYFDMMLWAALPFGIIWLIVIYFVAKKIQKDTESWDKYEDINPEDYNVFTPTPEHKRATTIFVIAFIAAIAYGLITKQKTGFVPFVMLALAFITGFAAKMKMNDIVSTFSQGMGKMTEMFLLFILLQPFIDLIMLGGGFEALSKVLMTLLESGGRVLLMLVGTFVGAFGIDGAAVAQIKITHELFLPAIEAMGLPMEMWAIGLIAASRITTSIYPTANMVGQMGIARSKNLKAMLLGGWAVSLAALVYIIFWAFIGEKIFF